MLQPQQFRIRCLGIIGSLAVAELLPAMPAIAQLVPDRSLGTEPSVVRSGTVNRLPAEVIQGGAQRGALLFHSFRDFNVRAGGRVYFVNPAGVQNIFTRVTGTAASNILGTLGVTGNANLFLLNPNGILFGPNARLDLRGSFVASSADRLLFSDGFAFSASDPQAPPLLTMTVPIGLQAGTTPGSIRVQGRGDGRGLQVGTGQTLALIGGEVRLDGGGLRAADGRIELGSVAGGRAIDLTPDAAGWGLSYAGVAQFQDIWLTQAARVNASGSGGGSIQVQARRLTLTGGSQMFTQTQGTSAGKNFTVRTTESVEVIGSNPQDGSSSRLDVQVRRGATGNGGNLTIETGALRVAEGGSVGSDTFGAGSSGNLTVQAQLVEVIGFNPQTRLPSFLATQAVDGTGNAGNLTIETGTLRVAEGAQVSSGIDGAGNSGNLSVKAQLVEVIGFNPQTRLPSFLATQAVDGTGNAGNLTIETGTLRVAEGGSVGSGTFGAGNSGNLSVKAQLVEVIGSNAQTRLPSFLAAQAERGSTGDAGNLTIETGTLRVVEGAVVSSSTFGVGKGGDLTVRARSVEVIGSDPVDNFPSSLSAQANRRSTGNAGNLTIETGTLRVAEGAAVTAGTLGAGKGGDLSVQARSVEVIGSDPQTGFSSRVSAQANPGSTGNAGNLTIETGTLRVARGAEVVASTFGTGEGGDLSVQARSVEVIGSDPVDGSSSRLSTQAIVGLTGNAGNLTIKVGTLRVVDGAEVTTSTFGAGKGGDLSVQARSVEVIGSDPVDGSSSFLSAQANPGATGNAGNLTIETMTLRVAEGAQVVASTFGTGEGGDLNVQARSVEVIGFNPRRNLPSVLSAQANSGSTGNAGNIFLTTDRLHLANRGEIRTTSLGTGSAGNITVQAGSQITLADQASINSNTNARQGNITLNTPLLLLRRNSSITTNARGAATGGNITIDAGFIVAGPNENNDIIANAFAGSGGQITLTAQSIFWLEPRTRQDLQQRLSTSSPTALDPRRLPSNDVTAFSQARPDLDVGSVTVRTLEVDPSRGLATLPTNLTTPQIAQTCQPRGTQAASQFIITGRGGLAPNPGEVLSSDALQVDLVTRNGTENLSQAQPTHSASNSTPTELVEAQGWIVDENGDVLLVAHAPTVQPDRWHPIPACLPPAPPEQ